MKKQWGSLHCEIANYFSPLQRKKCNLKINTQRWYTGYTRKASVFSREWQRRLWSIITYFLWFLISTSCCCTNRDKSIFENSVSQMSLIVGKIWCFKVYVMEIGALHFTGRSEIWCILIVTLNNTKLTNISAAIVFK